MNYIPNVARKGAAGTLLPVRNGVGRLRTVLAAALLLLVILPASAQRIVVNVTAKKQTLADILPQISKQTGIEFSYALELVKTRSNAAGRLEGDVKDVLGRILAGTGIDYRMQGSNRIFLSRKAGPGPESPAAPGKYRLTGTVRDGQGQPLVGVTVIVGGTDGTATGSDGSYSLMVAPDATLTFRYIGYGSVTEAVNNRSQIDVVMKDQSTELEELVVVGYRTVKKLSLTGSVASVDIKRKENQPITNSTQMLYNTPGIWVNQGGSQPGRDNATISIRGVNSLNSTGGAPLVLLDGVETGAYDLTSLRQAIGVVPQKAVLFKGTIRQNLLWGNASATDSDLWEALTVAQAKEVVEGKENGLDAPVEQGGVNFSGGQRQRLTIARALVRKPRILILDDSASALDYATDAGLRMAIRRMDDPPTTFIVSQRAASVRYADEILVLDDGVLAGKGTHDELLESCPVYQEIYYSQFPKEAVQNG